MLACGGAVCGAGHLPTPVQNGRPVRHRRRRTGDDDDKFTPTKHLTPGLLYMRRAGAAACCGQPRLSFYSTASARVPAARTSRVEQGRGRGGGVPRAQPSPNLATPRSPPQQPARSGSHRHGDTSAAPERRVGPVDGPLQPIWVKG